MEFINNLNELSQLKKCKRWRKHIAQKKAQCVSRLKVVERIYKQLMILNSQQATVFNSGLMIT